MDEINKSQIKLSQLLALLVVAECKNFSEAALRLKISQSAVSHAIASLEEQLGVVLFYRGRHGAHLTPVGERIKVHASQALRSVNAIKKEADLEKGLQGGIVRVACFRSVATHILPTAIAKFHSIFPDINVKITENDSFLSIEESLRTGFADIGFTYLPSNNEFETWEILRDDYIVLLPPKTNLDNQQISWQQLAEFPLIISSLSPCQDYIRPYLNQAEYPMKIAYEIREDSTIVSMVGQGLGAAIMPRLAAEPLPIGIKECNLPVRLQRIIGVAVLANALHSPAIYAFLDALKNTGRFAVKISV
ncbi:LysR family transcriptional regulator [Phormidium sp. LEGE 05292]|uniref:LysR family transcriptional regulator n=1 Tax=[Phormidium] sp. LEGE 05292 TaxID=767427 RepID=UPI0018821599|nr:LysR family transcriptional regulator [Phormidium sp. LEGE 05292]MBE9226588.1 LysR family transcriptional regulator [Phormidium sp. LEGE 05292]